MEITLEAVKDGGWHRYLVTFANARQAIAWATAREGTGTWLSESEDAHIDHPFGPVEPDVLDLLEYLDPTCHHGLSSSMCMDPYGPNHWGTIEQERAGMF